ncbi:MAG: hypothetical protein HYY85_09020 [Deltaproteobacteria bacterium]|nr:hypothetical protein [Deltaproteobacteria bacterium]
MRKPLLFLAQDGRDEVRQAPAEVAPTTPCWIVPAVALASQIGAHGCGAIGLTRFEAGSGAADGTGVTYTLDSIAYKTFGTPLEDLQRATLRTLKRMDIEVKETWAAESGTKIVGAAGDHPIEIELEPLTSETSRMRVNARMDIEVKADQPTQSGRRIAAVAGDRPIDIELEHLTSKTSRMRVDATRGWLLKDRATATEIIAQTVRTLEDELVRLSAWAGRASSPSSPRSAR